MRFSRLFTVALLVFVFLAGLARAEGPPVANLDPPIARMTEPPTAKIPCGCSDGKPCTCPPGDCHCPECLKHVKGISSIAEWAAAAAIGNTDVPAPATVTRTVMQRRCFINQFGQQQCMEVPVTVVEAAPVETTYKAGEACPCCGMIMTEAQAAKAKASRPAAPPVTYAAPVATSYTTGFTSYGAGDCASCASCASGGMMMGDDGSGGCGASAGSGRRGFPIIRRIFGGRRGGRGGCSGGGCGG